MNLAAVDIVLLLVILVMTIRCIVKGFISELFSFISIVGGILMAFLFDSRLALLVDQIIQPTRWNTIIAFLLIFIVFYLVVKIFEGALIRLLDKLNLEKLDKALGLFLGIVEGSFVVVGLIYLVNFLPFTGLHKVLDESVIAGFINGVFSWVPGQMAYTLGKII